MTDRKKVLAELENIQVFFEARADMAVGAGKIRLLAYANAARDARELLKEQEPITPIYKNDMQFCGACRYAIPNTINYCPRCGRKVNWND